MPKLTVNGNEVEFDQGMTVLQACELAGEEIPRFCYHERLKIAGNCRMCLVEIEGGPPKPAASCAMPAAEGMSVHTNTPMVKNAREGVMEFLLVNHPLDCPICDQGGECDLQDQAMTYGRGESRYDEHKRAVKDKYMGPLVKTHMTRCIHCTRCVRFLDDVGGIQELGAVNRGEHMEISTYVEKSLSSELSGNIIDLCPVGALTSKPYAFKARSWELRKTNGIDVFDAVGSNIRIDYRGREVMRILPRLHEDINEEWLSDKSRFSYDGLALQRVDRPYIRKNGKLQACTLEEAFAAIQTKLAKTDASKVAAISGDLADCESLFALKKLAEAIGTPHIDCRQDGSNMGGERGSYIFNSSIAGIEDADACLIIGSNPRHEAAILNARIRKSVLYSDLKVGVVAQQADLTYPHTHIGDDAKALESIANGKHEFAKILKSAKKPIIIVGSQIYSRDDANAVLDVINTIADKFRVITKDYNGFNVLQRAASRVGALDLGFVPGTKGKATNDILTGCNVGDIEVLYLLGADELDLSQTSKTFVIYQGHHGDTGAQHADVILPGAAYTEKHGTYVNTEGRVQRMNPAVFPPNEAKEDWQLIAELAAVLEKDLGFNCLNSLRAAIEKQAPHFAELDSVAPQKVGTLGKKGKVTTKKFINPVENFYMTDSISRASKTMAKCTSDIRDAKANPQEAA